MISVPEVRAHAAELGFIACGIGDLAESRFGDALDRWLARGFGGTMRYLDRQAAKRKQPASIVPGAVRAVVVLENYYPGRDAKDAKDAKDAQDVRDAQHVQDPTLPSVPSAECRVPKISNYARGRDYHLEVAERLERLAAILRAGGATIARTFVDAGPVPERELALRAGLGWIGKNTMLIRPGVGSFFFIGCILTDLPLPVDPSFEPDHCGTCTRCLDACPTGALVEPRVLDATRCISYLTIEYRGEIASDLATRLDGWAFGCDVCNEVCPWNERFSTATERPAYDDRGIPRADPDFFERLSDVEFAERFADTPLERAGLAGMRRNFRNAVASLREPT